MEELFALLDWNGEEGLQEEGIRRGALVCDLTPLFQPIDARFNKNVWENCARIICERRAEELNPHIIPMLQWLQDMNWPGAERIFKRLMCYEDAAVLAEAVEECMSIAQRECDEIWIENLSQLRKDEAFV